MKASEHIKQANRIVIKVGSALLMDLNSGDINTNWINSLSDDINFLFQKKKEVVLVSSGATALGRKSLGIEPSISPADLNLDLKQAAAAIGQIMLSETYHEAFARHDITVGQVLLTPHDTENRRSHLNARATIEKLIENEVLPIINENDTVSTSQVRFGDNDRLAARVAQMIKADLLIQLSTTDGFYTSDPNKSNYSKLLEEISHITDEHYTMAGDAAAGVSTGGMRSKLDAAQIAMSSGTHMILTKGSIDHPIQTLIEEKNKATVFVAKDNPVNSRKRWILAHITPKGQAIIDQGASKALLSGKSLLPAGVQSVAGEFERGDAINIVDENGKTLAIGLSAYNLEESQKIIGKKSEEFLSVLGYAGRDVLVHRDDLVLQD